MNGKPPVLSALQKFEQVVWNAVARLLPGAAGNFGAITYARIERVNTTWGKCDDRAKAYSCDVQVLRPDLSDDPDIEVIRDVPLDPALFGQAVAVFSQPVVGAIARIAFMYRNPGYPFILSVTAEKRSFPGQGIPAHPGQVPGETFIDNYLRHTHLVTGIGAPTTSVQATIPPGGPVLEPDLQE